jgi:hypothetical protein
VEIIYESIAAMAVNGDCLDYNNVFLFTINRNDYNSSPLSASCVVARFRVVLLGGVSQVN